MKELSLKARIYITSIIALGVFSWVHGLYSYQGRHLGLCAMLALLGVAIGKLKIRLPGVPGHVSVSYIFVFAAMVLLGPTDAMLIASLCVLIESFAQAESRPRFYQIAFGISTASTSAYLAGWSYWLIQTAGQKASVQAQIIALVAATLIYFITSTLSVRGALRLTSRTGILLTWYQKSLATAACFFAGSVLLSMIALYLHNLSAVTCLVALPPLLLICYSYRLHLRRIEDDTRHVKQVEDLHFSTIEALALAIEAKDHTACEHIQRVQAYAVRLAQALSLSEDQTQAIKEAALLHDIGKLAVPEYILSKPGLLAPKEFEKMSVHPLVGYQILSMINFQSPVAEIVLCHHERWDGTGYPNGLKEEQIPIGARILAVVDCFEALTANRPHRPAVSPEEATAHILSESGKAFDPKVVEVFYAMVDSLRAAGDRALTEARIKRAQLDSCKILYRPPFLAPCDVPPLSVYEAIGAANKEISALYELAQAVGTTLQLTETLNMVAAKIKQILPSSTIAIYLLENQELAPRFVEGVDEQIFRGLRIPLGKGISGWVAANRQSILNTSVELEFAGVENAHIATYLQSAISVPLMASDKLIGVLTLYDLKPNRFEEDSLRLLETVSAKVAIAVRNSLIFEQAHEEALTDPITGLPNSRFLFMRLDQEIARARRNGTRLAVLAMDLDNFKQVNDTMGHLIGDKVLIRVSRLLRSCLREYDFIARTGGDEFVALLVDMSQEAVERKIEIIQKEIADLKVDSKGDKPIPLGISIGYSSYGKDGQDTDTLLTVADTAMYRSKRARRSAQVLASAGLSPEGHLVHLTPPRA